MDTNYNLNNTDYSYLFKKVADIVKNPENGFRQYSLENQKELSSLKENSKITDSYIVLSEDTCVELGASNSQSINMALWSKKTKVANNKLWVAGPDFDELKGKSVPFLQLVMLEFDSVAEVIETDVSRLKNLSNKIPGFMTRSLQDRYWVRIHNDLVSEGFSLLRLGMCINEIFLEAFGDIVAMDIVLITDYEKLISEFVPIYEAARVISGNNTKLKWVQDGVISCDEMNCGTCGEKPTCDTLKKIVIKKVSRKGE